MPTSTEGRRVLDRFSPSEGPNHLGSSGLCLGALSQSIFYTCASSKGGEVSNPEVLPAKFPSPHRALCSGEAGFLALPWKVYQAKPAVKQGSWKDS